jgi:flagellar hook-associated protein 3 FlgL
VNLRSSLNQTQASQEESGDDPVAAAQNVQLLNTIQQDDSFTQTTSLTQGMLQVTDSALGSMVTQLNQALSLAGQANNGTPNTSVFKAISNQIAGIRDEVLSLANSNDQGQSVFGGSQTATTPFTLNSATTPAAVTYNGDSDVNTLVSPTGQSIQLNVPGNQVFTSAAANFRGTFDNLVADHDSGTAGSGVADTAV